jgi:sugar phosphate isomerase/epimerase
MKLGVCHAVTLPGEWEEAIAQAGALGFAGIELFVRQPTIPDLLDHPERVSALRAAAQQAGVSFPSLGLVYFGPGFRLFEADPAVRGSVVERARQGVERCAALGATVALVPGAPALDDGAAVDAYVDSLQALVPTAERLGVRLGIETGYTADETLTVLGRVNSPWVGDYFDTGNAAGRGMDPVEEIRRRRGKIVQIHVKGVRGADLDAGTVDLAGVKQALADTDYPGWLLLETSAGENALDNARRNLAVLRQFFAD